MSDQSESGSVLSILLERFYRSPDEVQLVAVLKCLRESSLYTALEADGKETVRQEEREWFCVYSTPGQIPDSCRQNGRLPFMDLLMRASSDPELDGLIVDRELHPFRIPRDFFSLLLRKL